MTATTPIVVSRQGTQEKAALAALMGCLLPWRLTLVDQRDDFGRDGFVQVVSESADGSLAISPLTFAVQSKSSSDAFPETHVERFETRHVNLWTASLASPLVIFVWSRATGEIRFRTASDVRHELDRSGQGWKEQGTVSVPFRLVDRFDAPASLDALSRIVTDELDQLGGVEKFHAARRRIV